MEQCQWKNRVFEGKAWGTEVSRRRKTVNQGFSKCALCTGADPLTAGYPSTKEIQTTDVTRGSCHSNLTLLQNPTDVSFL